MLQVTALNPSKYLDKLKFSTVILARTAGAVSTVHALNVRGAFSVRPMSICSQYR